MLVMCDNYVGIVRFKDKQKSNNTFNFRFEQNFGVKNDNRHRRFSYFGESYTRFDKKAHKIKNN